MNLKVLIYLSYIIFFSLDLGFNDIDDYILINMRHHSEFYSKLLVSKGDENVKKRSAFLNLNE